jgi:hypothetical protein
MRALGPGSVSSFLKTVLDVVYFAIIVMLALLALGVIAGLLAISFVPDLFREIADRG